MLKALRQNTAFRQREVAARVRQKYAAKPKFLADEGFDEGSHIDALLRAPPVARDLATPAAISDGGAQHSATTLQSGAEYEV